MNQSTSANGAQTEAIQRAGMTAIRLAHEGDQQAAETIRAQQARIAELEAKPQCEVIGWIDSDTLASMKDAPASPKTRWPLYRLTEWCSKEGLTPLYASPAAPAPQAAAAPVVLPEPDFRLKWHGRDARYTVSKPNIGDTDCYTADTVRDVLAATQAAVEHHCGVCGADEAFTGTCGGGRTNPRALCFEGACPAATPATGVPAAAPDARDALIELMASALKTIGTHTITDDDGDEVEVLFGDKGKIDAAIAAHAAGVPDAAKGGV